MARRLFAIAFCDELGPLFVVYTLWFLEVGVSVAQTSAVFALWAGISIALEVPSGALADRVDRRYLLAAATVLRAGAIALWLLWPGPTGVLVGAALWAVHGALHSGAWEALVYDQLEAREQADHYARVMARIGQLGLLGTVFGSLLALGMSQKDISLQWMGWLTVAGHVLPFALVLSLPATVSATERDGDDDEPASFRAWWATLRQGVGLTRTQPLVRRAVVLGAALEGMFIVDEYVPIIAQARQAGELAPWAMAALLVGTLGGGELAARRPTLQPRTLGAVLAAGTVVMMAALLLPQFAALFGVAVGYAALEVTWVLTDARLQAQLPHAVRATATSVRAFLAGTLGASCFAAIGLLSRSDPSWPLACTLVVLLLAALALVRE